MTTDDDPHPTTQQTHPPDRTNHPHPRRPARTALRPGLGRGGRSTYHSPLRRRTGELMDKPTQLTYRSAGLDLDLYDRTIAGMEPLVRRTHDERVIDGFGGFASLFSLDFNTKLFARNYKHPVLVSCTDGVGTKLKVAAM